MPASRQDGGRGQDGIGDAGKFDGGALESGETGSLGRQRTCVWVWVWGRRGFVMICRHAWKFAQLLSKYLQTKQTNVFSLVPLIDAFFPDAGPDGIRAAMGLFDLLDTMCNCSAAAAAAEGCLDARRCGCCSRE